MPGLPEFAVPDRVSLAAGLTDCATIASGLPTAKALQMNSHEVIGLGLATPSGSAAANTISARQIRLKGWPLRRAAPVETPEPRGEGRQFRTSSFKTDRRRRQILA